MLNRFLKTICRQKGCVTFDGCSPEEIRAFNTELNNNNFGALPAEYAEFLQTHNGIVYDGLELLGTTPHKRLQREYTLGSILDINKRYSQIDYFARKLILGELPESFLIYDAETSGYEIVDRLNLDSRRIFSSFNELFKTISAFLVIKD